MNIFLDSSVLIKLYHDESGTKKTLDILQNSEITNIILSDIAKLEFSSALWKKARMKELSISDIQQVISLFSKDWKKFHWIDLNNEIIIIAYKKFAEYGEKGLRSLDSIQLASAIHAKNFFNSILCLTSDQVLYEICNSEKIKTEYI